MADIGVTLENINSMTEFGKCSCLSMVHAGTNKGLSNNAIIENWKMPLTGKLLNCSFFSVYLIKNIVQLNPVLFSQKFV